MILNYSFLDGGFYLFANYLPQNKYFCTLNNKNLTEMHQEHEQMLQNKEVDLIKYQIQVISGSNNKCNETEVFSNLDGESAFELVSILEILIIFSMSYIFEYGYEIQKDSKGKMYKEEN